VLKGGLRELKGGLRGVISMHGDYVFSLLRYFPLEYIHE
jgi:hypothetical protein